MPRTWDLESDRGRLAVVFSTVVDGRTNQQALAQPYAFQEVVAHAVFADSLISIGYRTETLLSS